MAYEDLYVAGCASALPPARTAEEAVAQGQCTAGEVKRTGMRSVTVAAPGDSGPALAARAAVTALERAGCPAPAVGLVLHATLYDQGHDLWGSASYVQSLALPGEHEPCPAMEIRQVSNGGMAALELASAWLRSGAARPAALLTAGDVFGPPGFDRWHSDPGTVYADGGAALVLSRTAGFARLRSLATFSEPRLEGMHRGDHPFALPADRARQVDLEECKEQFLARTGRQTAIALVSGGQRRALQRALSEADAELDDITHFVLPNLGRRRLEAAYFRGLGIDPEKSTWSWASQVGHLGAGDQFAGLAHLVETKQVAAGDRVLLAGVGAGFSWSAAVVDIDELPSWPEPL